QNVRVALVTAFDEIQSGQNVRIFVRIVKQRCRLARAQFPMTLNESIVEDAALSWFKELGYSVAHAPHLAPGETAAERSSFGDVVLISRLREAITRLNPAIPSDAREEALRKVLRHDASSLVGNNRAFHRMLRDGVPVEYRRDDGSIAGDQDRKS